MSRTDFDERTSQERTARTAEKFVELLDVHLHLLGSRDSPSVEAIRRYAKDRKISERTVYRKIAALMAVYDLHGSCSFE